VIITAGVSSLLPGRGFQDLYNKFETKATPLVAAFVELNLTY
jgi:hypothetical protein